MDDDIETSSTRSTVRVEEASSPSVGPLVSVPVLGPEDNLSDNAKAWRSFGTLGYDLYVKYVLDEERASWEWNRENG